MRDLSGAGIQPAKGLRVANMHVIRDVEPSQRTLSLLAQPDRNSADRALDSQKSAAELLELMRIEAGMRVAVLASGGGYLAELAARAAQPGGLVISQNTPRLIEKHPEALDAWRTRSGYVRVESELYDPLPAMGDFDLVVLDADYRALPHLGVDTRSMNLAIRESLRKGGRYIVMDRATPKGARTTGLFERLDEESANARYDIERNGFGFRAMGHFFESPDRFVLMFARKAQVPPSAAGV